MKTLHDARDRTANTPSLPDRAAEAEAIPCVIGHNKLTRKMIADGRAEPVYLELMRRLEQNVSDVAAFMDLGTVAEVVGCMELGTKLRSTSLIGQRLFRLASASAPRLRLLGLAIEGRLTANMPIDFLLEDSDVELIWMYLKPGEPLPPIPEHDLAVVLGAEREESSSWLRSLGALLSKWPHPVLNRPESIPSLGREALCGLMAGVAGVSVPPTARVDAERLTAIATERLAIDEVLSHGAFPILARPVDSHAGHGLEEFNTPAEIEPYLLQQSQSAYFISPFVDYSSPDGRYRKYRIAVIDGEPYPSHLAISENWIVHYMTAGMEESAAKRFEEAEFMSRFQEDFGGRHKCIFAEMTERSGLDYFVVDCAEMHDGRLLVFEADTAHIVHNIDPPEVFPYKAAPMRALFEAFRAMLFRKAAVVTRET